MRLRVIVYNVRGFRDGFERLVRLVGHFEPDLLLLNETGGRLRLRRFAKVLGMDLVADPRSPLRRRVKDAVLVRPPWTISEHRQHRFEGGSWLYPRGALIATLGHGGARLCAISTHLGLHPRERLEHARALVALVDHVGAPTVAGGDLNEKPDGRAVGFLSERFRDAWLLGGDADGGTFPADEPTARIDYLFVSDGVVVERVLVPPGPDAREASDHRPLVAELTLPGSG
jgi:endonuclease/exonuclease/phosphatase family metal-dependent hydrolase